MRRSIGCFSLVAALAIAVATSAAAERRRALVVGNNAYANVERLAKAVNDARTIAATLRSVGFEVAEAEDATRRDFNRALAEFTGGLERGDVALFFYAGHGVEIEGRNYLLPSDIPDARPGEEQFVRSEAIPVDQVLDAIQRTGARVSILIIDACRDNPFAREGTRSLGGTRGLALMEPTKGTFIMYSAGVGQTALDRLGAEDAHPNSVFTRSLAPLLTAPGMTLTETARTVRRSVEELARTVSHEQRPAYYDEVSGDYYLAGAAPGAAPAPQPATPTVVAPPAPPVNPAAEAWDVTKDTDSPAVLEAFIAEFPGTVYATLAAARLEELRAAEEESEPETTVATVAPPRAPTPPPPAPQRGSGAAYHYVTGLDPAGDNWLALRSQPTTSGSLVVRMGPDTLLQVTGREGAWLGVLVQSGQFAGYSGWAYGKYVACCRTGAGAAPPGTVTTQPQETISLHYLTGLDPAGDNWLALRSEPSGRGRRLAKMGPETLLYVVSREGSWLEVVVQNTEFEGYRGWAHANYIACCREVPVAGPAPTNAARRTVLPEEQLLTFVRDVYLAAATGSEVPAWAFASTIDYYDSGRVSRDRVLQEKANYYRKWPRRSYSLLPGTFSARASTDGYDVEFEYRFSVANASSRISGRGISYLSLVQDGGSFRITRERGEVLERD